MAKKEEIKKDKLFWKLLGKFVKGEIPMTKRYYFDIYITPNKLK